MRCFILFALMAVASATIAPLLENIEPVPGRYLIKLKDDFDIGESIDTVRLFGGEVRFTYKSVLHGFAAKLTDRVLNLVRNLPAVEYVEQVGVYRADKVEANYEYALPWGLNRIDQRSLPLESASTGYDGYEPYGNGGEGWTVWVLDTAVRDTHTSFTSEGSLSDCPCADKRVSNNMIYNFAYDGCNFDCNGHGTHCAGTVGGDKFGVASKANIVGLKVLSCEGYGYTDEIIRACDFVIDQAQSSFDPYRHVVSMSIGGGLSTTFNNAIERLVAAGVATVVSAGNSNTDACTQSPAAAPSALTVAATDESDYRASFSNYGDCVDIFAPGVMVESAYYTSDTATWFMSGTSMACPHVAGAITLHGSAHNVLSRASKCKVHDAMGSPNLLLYVGSEPSEPYPIGWPDCQTIG